MNISKFENLKELLPTDTQKKSTRMETYDNNKRNTGFNCSLVNKNVQLCMDSCFIHHTNRLNISQKTVMFWF
jgi:hypothetical protein